MIENFVGNNQPLNNFVSQIRTDFLNKIGIFVKITETIYSIQVDGKFLEWNKDTNTISKGKNMKIESIEMKKPIKDVCGNKVIIQFMEIR